jgi:hypothetical protein
LRRRGYGALGGRRWGLEDALQVDKAWFEVVSPSVNQHTASVERLQIVGKLD